MALESSAKLSSLVIMPGQRKYSYYLLGVIICLIPPGLGMITNEQFANLKQGGMHNVYLFVTWLSGAAILYILWLAIWNSWKIDSKAGRILGLVVIACVAIAIPFLLQNFIHNDIHPELNWTASMRLFLASVLFLVIQYALKAQQNIAQLNLDKEQLKTQNYKVQLSALQNKVDPHFLFNSMNTLLAMVRKGDEHTEPFIIHLSDFYRQTLKHNENQTIPLAEELAMLDAYLFLMKKRNEHAVEIDIDIPNENLVKHIPTMALQTIVENCFKHNSMTSKMPLKISIQVNEEGWLKVSNNLNPKMGAPSTSGEGLNILKKRYDLLGVAEALRTTKTNSSFSTLVKLI